MIVIASGGSVVALLSARQLRSFIRFSLRTGNEIPVQLPLLEIQLKLAPIQFKTPRCTQFPRRFCHLPNPCPG